MIVRKRQGKQRRPPGATTVVMALGIYVAISAWGVVSEAWAVCPNCLGQTRTLTPTLQLLGIFLLVPFVVAFLVFRAIRRACAPGARVVASPGIKAPTQ